MKKRYMYLLSVFFLIFPLFFSLLSCEDKNKNINTLLDTIKSPDKRNNDCLEITKGYSVRYGAVISNYYEVIDELDFDINEDGKVDTLVILTPASLTIRKYNKCTDSLVNESRLLVKFMKVNNKKSQILTHSNIIYNQLSGAWLGSEYFDKDENKNKNGFILKGSRGQGCKFNYSIFISNSKQVFYVDSIMASYYCPSDNGVSENKVYFSDKKLLLSSYKRTMLDSLCLNWYAFVP